MNELLFCSIAGVVQKWRSIFISSQTPVFSFRKSLCIVTSEVINQRALQLAAIWAKCAEGMCGTNWQCPCVFQLHWHESPA